MKRSFLLITIILAGLVAVGFSAQGIFAAETCAPNTVCSSGILCPENGVCPSCPIKADGSFDLGQCNPLGSTGVNKNILDVVCLVAKFFSTVLLPPIAVLMVLWASFLYLTGLDKPQNITSAKQILVFTVIGAGILVLAPALITLVLGLFSGGAGQTPGACSQLATTSSFTTVLTNLINWFSWFLAVSSVAAGLYSGFLYMTSSGDPRNTAIAGKTLFYAVVGIAVAILSFSIISLIESFIVP